MTNVEQYASLENIVFDLIICYINFIKTSITL